MIRVENVGSVESVVRLMTDGGQIWDASKRRTDRLLG